MFELYFSYASLTFILVELNMSENARESSKAKQVCKNETAIEACGDMKTIEQLPQRERGVILHINVCIKKQCSLTKRTLVQLGIAF